MSVNKQSKKISILIYVIFAVFYVWMAFQIPYTHDDWDWGLDEGLHQLLYATVNSRYIGNFFVVIMTRSEILKTLIMGAVYFSIPYILSSFAAKYLQSDTPFSHGFLFLICNGFLFTVNQILWRETYGWVSGFANFAISSLFLLLWVKEILTAADSPTVESKDSAATIAAYFVICFCGQLFIENLSIFCFGLGVLLTIFYLIKFRKIPGRILSMTAAAFLGLIIIFSSSLYSTLLSDGTALEGYREITLFSNTNILFSLYTALLNLGRRFYSVNTPLTIAILLLLICLLLQSRRTSKEKYQKLFLFTNGFLVVSFFSFWINAAFCHHYTRLIEYFEFFAAVFCFFTVLIQTFLLFRGRIRRIQAALWICAPMVLAPLLVTTETGYRLFLTSLIFQLLFALILLVSCMNLMSKKACSVTQGVAVCLTAALLCFYINVYAGIGEVKQIREEIIETAVQNGVQTITLPAYPFTDYLHHENPKNAHRIDYFKEFYGIPPEVNIVYK